MDEGPELPPQVAEKVKALEAQLAAQPKAKALYLQLSQLYADHGHTAHAIQALERCLQVDPGNALVKHKLNLLTHAGVGTASATAGLHKPQAPRFVPRAAPARRGVPVWAWIVGGLVLVAVGVAVKVLVFPDARLVVADSFDARAPQWAPGDGDRLAFLQGENDLAVHDLDKGSTETVARKVWGGFAWSPDGSRLAYVAEPAPDAEDDSGYGQAVYVLELATKKATRVASGSGPSWSPDGTRLALLCHGTPARYDDSSQYETVLREGTPPGPCVVDVADGHPRMLAVEMAQNLLFAPDRPTIVYETWSEEGLQAAGADAGPPATLNAHGNDEFQQFAEDAVAGQPRNVYEGSRDLGRRAEAMMYDQKKKAGAAAGGAFFGTDVFVVGDDGSNPVRLTEGGRSGAAHWTADGRILFAQDSAAGPQLMTVNPDGSDLQPVFSKPVRIADPSSAAMTRDRKRVVFVAPVQVANAAVASIVTGESSHDLFVSRVGDPSPRRLENRHAFKQRFSLSPDGKRIVYEVKNDKSGRSELWVMSL
jgi:WD40-like Beta Propeller Repeat